MSRVFSFGLGSFNSGIAQSPVAVTPVYVTTAGNDTLGNGSTTLPYATIDKALTAAPIGATIFVGDGTYTPATNVFAFTKTVTVCPVNPGQVTFAVKSGQNYIAQMQSTTGATMTTIGINWGPAPVAPVRLVAQTTPYTYQSLGDKYLNYTVNAIIGAAANDTANVVVNNCTFTTTTGSAAIRRTALTTGNTFLGYNNFSGSTSAASNGLAWYLFATASGATAQMIGNTLNYSTSYTSGETYANSTWSVKTLAQYNNISISSTNGGSGTALWFTQATGTPILTSGSEASYNTIYQDCSGGGHTIMIGTDGDPSGGRNYTNDGKINYNTITVSTASQNAGVHGPFFGWTTNGYAVGNVVKNVRYTLLSKGNAGNVVFASNLLIDSYSYSAYVKGSQSGGKTHYLNNTTITKFSTNQGLSAITEVATGLTPVIGEYRNNICHFTGNPGQAIYLPASVTGPSAISNNSYSFNTGTARTDAYVLNSDTTPLTYTFAQWQTAKESTAINSLPSFVNESAGTVAGSSLSSSSALISAGVASALVPNDLLGLSFLNPPSLGAIQYR